MLRNVFALLFIISSIYTFGQSSLEGNATDDIGNPINQAEIILKNANHRYQAVTDDNGYYIFDGVVTGDYELLIKKNKKQNKFNIQINQQRNTFDPYITLNDDVHLNEAIITKFRSVKPQMEREGFAMNVIETQEAALRNIQTNELLDQTVGVRIRQNGGLGARVEYNLNGMSGNSIKIFVDGLPISTYGSSFSLNSIPPALIERIEVYKGVVPVNLSEDALGGAINIVLKESLRNTLNASVSYGSFNTLQANVFGSYRAKSGLTTRISGFYNGSDNDYKVWGDHVYNILPDGRQEKIKAKRFNDAYESYGGMIELGWTKMKWADHLMFSYNRSYNYNEIQHGQYMTKPYKGRFQESDANVVGLLYDKKDLFIKGLDFNIHALYSKNEEVINDTVKYNYNWDGQVAIGLHGDPILSPNGAQQGAPTINHIDRHIFTLRSNVGYEFARNHTLIFNNLFYDINRDEQDEMKPELERSFIEKRDLQKQISSIAYQMQAFNKKFKSNLFGKYYIQKTKKIDPQLVENESGEFVRENIRTQNKTDQFGYGIATSYLFGDAFLLMFSAEKAVRLPSETEIFGNPGENVIGNVSIKPEISNNFNLGIKIGPFKYQQHRVSLSTSGFIRNTQDKIARRTNVNINDAIQTLPYENLGKTQSIGFEAELSYHFGRNLNILLNMSKFNSLYKVKYDNNGNILPNYDQQLPNEPYFTANGSLRYTFRDLLRTNEKIALHYHFGYVDSFNTTWLKQYGSQTPKQFIQDIGLSYTFPKRDWIVSFDVRNIFDKQAFDNYAVQKPGRAFYLKLNYTINKL